jgi:hypothetical protein
MAKPKTLVELASDKLGKAKPISAPIVIYVASGSGRIGDIRALLREKAERIHVSSANAYVMSSTTQITLGDWSGLSKPMVFGYISAVQFYKLGK